MAAVNRSGTLDEGGAMGARPMNVDGAGLISRNFFLDGGVRAVSWFGTRAPHGRPCRLPDCG